MDIMIILLILIAYGIINKWEKHDTEKRYRKHKEEQKERGLYYDRTKL